MYLFAHSGFYQQVLTSAEPLMHNLAASEQPQFSSPRHGPGYALLSGALALTYTALGRLGEAGEAYAQSRSYYSAIGVYYGTTITAQYELA